MTALELRERKKWALEVLQACDSEEAISSMEALARKLLCLEKKEPKRSNCFTVEESLGEEFLEYRYLIEGTAKLIYTVEEGTYSSIFIGTVARSPVRCGIC